MSALTLGVVVCSTRPGRAGAPIAQWFLDRARAHGKFGVELVDLATVALPIFDEPKHPRFGDYQHEHTKAWSRTVRGLDAFVFVTPEYNYGSPPALVNALHYLFAEWACKAAGFVSYGGLSGGTRSVQMTKQFLTTLKVMPLPEAVNIPFFTQHLHEGVFTGTEAMEKSAAGMLDELHRWSEALRPLRG